MREKPNEKKKLVEDGEAETEQEKFDEMMKGLVRETEEKLEEMVEMEKEQEELKEEVEWLPQMIERWKASYALTIFNTARGEFLIYQALTVAIERMRKVPISRRNIRDIEDMDVLRDNLSLIYALRRKP